MLSSIRVYKLNEKAILPSRKHRSDAGLDLYSLHTTSIIMGVAVLNTGIAIEIPEGFVGLIRPKSRSDFDVFAGVIDAGYQGEIKVKIYVPPTIFARSFSHGEAIAQLLIIPVETPELEIVNSVDELYGNSTSRGASGGIHGSVQEYQSKNMEGIGDS